MVASLRVLLIEDSEDDAMLLVRELRRGGFQPDTLRVDTADAMREALGHEIWDVIITDHNMPGFSSEAALSIVQQMGVDIPIIIVSGSIGEDIAVAAMKTGAHDYIMKDNLTRLVPAIERELREVDTRRAHRQAEETIRHMAYHDALTGLTNRHDFERRLQLALESAHTQNLHHALLYLDLDQFKIINDTCGHVAGDELLKQIAVILQDCIRESDTLARLGGDEFGVLLERCPLDRATEIANQLLQAIKDFRFVWQGKTFALGASIGLVIITDDAKSMSDVLSAADMACYAAKDKGRSRTHIYSDDDKDLAQRHGEMQWVARINRALEEDRFLLFKQTIVPLTPSVSQAPHFECLLRMVDDDGEMILPGAFIPAAERYNLMPALDRWVVNRAFTYMAQCYAKEGKRKGAGMVFINLSGTSLSDDAFFPYIIEQLQSHKLSPDMICFEITETAAIANLSTAIDFIKEIKSYGCHFALDDFGSGLSSFSYLKTIPVDFLKIDGVFIRDMLDDPMDSAIVEAVNQIAHTAGLQTIAEFVESEAIQQKLRQIGVDYAQGYGIEKPKPLESSGSFSRKTA